MNPFTFILHNKTALPKLSVDTEEFVYAISKDNIVSLDWIKFDRNS